MICITDDHEANIPPSTSQSDCIKAIVFDLDGILIDSEHIYDVVKKEFVERFGGRWLEAASAEMMGMSPNEWPHYMHSSLQLTHVTPDEIRRQVIDGVERKYAEQIPFLPGAAEAVERLAGRWKIALASSSSRVLIDLVLAQGGIRKYFNAVVASEEVAAGKPAPDVYIEACRKLNVGPSSAVAVEDSPSGIVSGSRAGMRVVAIPHKDYPPAPETLQMADLVLDRITDLSIDILLETFCGELL